MFSRNISNQTTVSGGQLCADKMVVRVSENLKDHPLSTYAKFSEKLTFLTPDTHTYQISRNSDLKHRYFK